MRSLVLTGLAIGGASALLAAACGGDPAVNTSTGGAGGGDGGNGGSSDGGTAGSGNSIAIVSSGGSGGTGNGSSNGGAGGACADDNQPAALLPLDIIIMLDRSLSMAEETAVQGVTKWDAIEQALVAFANDAQSVGIGVGIQYFPANPTCTQDGECPGSYCYLNACNNSPSPVPCQSDADCPGMVANSCVPVGECGAATCTNVGGTCIGGEACVGLTESVCVVQDICPTSFYSTPDVAIAPLPGSAMDLTDSLASRGPAPIPYGLTPTGPALQGAIDYAKTYETANPRNRVITVLATDGAPTICAPTGTNAVAAIAAVGVATEPKIETFTIGVFTPTDMQGPMNIQAIADQGEGEAFVIDPNGNVEQQFIDALNEIRTAALSCEFDLPQPPPGEALDYNKVNVDIVLPGGEETTLNYVVAVSGCDPVDGGWYYDQDPAQGGTPTSIKLCPASCDVLKDNIGSSVQIRVGCETVTGVPK